MSEVCEKCGQIHNKRIDLMLASKEDVDEFKLVQNKINCARQAVTPSAIPDGVDDNKVKLFVQAAIDSLASYQWLQQDLWARMIEKYDLPKDKNVYVDFGNGMFYYL